MLNWVDAGRGTPWEARPATVCHRKQRRSVPLRENIIRDRSFALAVRTVRLARHLRRELGEHDIASQVLRSGTSVGANVEEALGAVSRRDFAHRMGVSAKECRETGYWLRLIAASGIMEAERVQPLLDECGEVLRILNSIILSTRQGGSMRRDDEGSGATDIPTVGEQHAPFAQSAEPPAAPADPAGWEASPTQDRSTIPTDWMRDSDSESRIQNSEFQP